MDEKVRKKPAQDTKHHNSQKNQTKVITEINRIHAKVIKTITTWVAHAPARPNKISVFEQGVPPS